MDKLEPNDPFIEDLLIELDDVIEKHRSDKTAGTYSKKMRVTLANRINLLFEKDEKVCGNCDNWMPIGNECYKNKEIHQPRYFDSCQKWEDKLF